MTGPTPATRPLTSARKTLEALDVIAEFRHPFRPPELSARLGWSRATTHQQLVTLVTAGWLERTGDGEYRLAVRAARLASAAAAQTAPSQRLAALLRDLVAETREAVTVTLPDGDGAQVLWRVLPDRPVWASAELGAKLSPRSASAQVMTAFRAPAVLPEPADERLAAIRAAGYAVYRSTDAVGVSVVAAPVFGAPRDGATAECVAAVTLSGPWHRFDPECVTGPLTRAAGRISELWQHVGPPTQ